MAAVIPNICKAIRIQFMSRQRVSGALLLRKMSGKAISDCDESTDNITEIFADERVNKYPVMPMTDLQLQEYGKEYFKNSGKYVLGPDGRSKFVRRTEDEFYCAAADDIPILSAEDEAYLLRKMSGKAISDCDESTDIITEASSDCDKSTENIPEIFADNDYNVKGEGVKKYPNNRMTARQWQEFRSMMGKYVLAKNGTANDPEAGAGKDG
ncbi:hypothetical protein V6N13_131795 [Hibiscus sabdariffa]